VEARRPTQIEREEAMQSVCKRNPKKIIPTGRCNQPGGDDFHGQKTLCRGSVGEAQRVLAWRTTYGCMQRYAQVVSL